MATNTQAGSRRISRKEARQARLRRDKRQRLLWIVGSVAVAALVIVYLVGRVGNQPGQFVADMGNQHIDSGTQSPVAYNSVPPTSGPHYGSLAEWGVHDEPIPNELQVHNLEDGGVGIWYDCPAGCPELVSQLESITQRYNEGVLMAPYPGLDNTIALTAWNRIDKFDAYDEDRVLRFVKAYRGIDHHVP